MLLDFLMMLVTAYIAGFVVYWKWYFIYKYVMSESYKKEFEQGWKNLFEIYLKVRGVKYTKRSGL